eukprot:scaffold4522_cov141-Skeletonema_menzelii.AAC.4
MQKQKQYALPTIYRLARKLEGELIVSYLDVMGGRLNGNYSFDNIMSLRAARCCAECLRCGGVVVVKWSRSAACRQSAGQLLVLQSSSASGTVPAAARKNPHPCSNRNKSSSLENVRFENNLRIAGTSKYPSSLIRVFGTKQMAERKEGVSVGCTCGFYRYDTGKGFERRRLAPATGHWPLRHRTGWKPEIFY